MSKIKRAIFPEAYQLIDGVKACEHLNFNDYFEKCEDCGMSLYDMPQEVQDLYEAQFTEEGIEEIIGKAEAIRDGMREDGIVI